MRILRAADYRRMPWKNGGGETAEIAVFPATATLEAIDWRLSMAVVASDGPFSQFPGVDRTLTVLDGAGFQLTVGAYGERHVLTRASAPLPFPADVPAHATLIGGAVTDLNVMTRRQSFGHSVERIVLPGTITRRMTAETVAVICCEGDVGCDIDGRAGGWLGARDTGLLTNVAPGTTLALTATRPGVALLVSIYRTAATPA